MRLQGIIPLEDIVDLSHLRDEDHLVYDSEEDAAGIFIEELGYWNDEIRKYFRSPYVYRISPNWGGFSVSPKRLCVARDCESYLLPLESCWDSKY